MGPAPGIRTAEFERRIMEAVADTDVIRPGEVIVHFDLVAVGRSLDDAGKEHIERHHFAIEGGDPHMSWGVLQAAADNVKTTQL